MTKLEFEKLLKPLVEIIDDIEIDLIYNVLERIDNYKDVKGSLKWYNDKLKELKLLEKDNKNTFKERKKRIKDVIEEIAKVCGTKIDNFDKLEDYYNQGLLNVNPINLYNSVSINNLINEAIKDGNDIMNLIQTKALESSKKEYMNILNKAYTETASGAYTYTESIRNAIDKMSENGIAAVHYKNGVKLSIESVVRRDIVTRMNKLVGDVEIQQAKELGTNLVYVDQHLGARVRTPYMKNDYEAHCEWQGKKYMIEGSNEKYDNLYEKTGYGEMLGLKGINCYHDMKPTFEWEKIPDRIDEKENKKKYELLHQQRAFEVKMRKLKRKRESYKATNDEQLDKASQKYKQESEKFNKWLKENNLTRDYEREYIVKVSKIKPKYEMYNNKTEYTIQEEQKLFETINNELDKEIDIESKWSGKININNNCSPAKEWDCSITIGSSTLKQEVQHELLHARSISHYGKEEYINYQFEEEATVELLNKQILQKNKMTYYDNAYANMVNKLEEISDIIGINKFDFAINLFKIRPSKRREWIINLAIENNKKEIIVDLLEEAYPKW